jgi:Nidogen-like
MKRAFLAAFLAAGLTLTAQAGVVRSGFNAGTLGRTDDASSASKPLGFSGAINFGGNTYNKVFDNNGNVTFDAALSAFTPFGIGSLNRAIIAPFFADVDTRNTASGITAYGTGTVDGYGAFGVTWKDVGYYNQKADKLNTFQLVLIDRADTGAGNFDIEFNYDKIQWETGDSSGGINGLGGTSAGIGYANAPGQPVFELPGSGVSGSFLDSNSATGLIYGSNVGMNGRFIYHVRDGMVVCDVFTPIPEPATLGFGLALAGICVGGRFRSARRGSKAVVAGTN